MENATYFCLSSRTVVESHTPAYSRIVYHFGPEILLENGEIDRQKLGQLIFANEEKRKLLNSITHPEIHKAMLKEILLCFLRGEGGTEFVLKEKTEDDALKVSQGCFAVQQWVLGCLSTKLYEVLSFRLIFQVFFVFFKGN